MFDAKKTKIIATVGPSSSSVEVLENLINAGMNVCRINMSHGDGDSLLPIVANIRKASENLNKDVSILLDLAGPKIRTGEYTTETIEIVANKKIILTSEKIIGDEKRIYVNYEKLPQEVKKGSIIMVDDGNKKLEVEKVVGNDIHCKIIVGGILKPRRGINVPGAYLSVSSVTEKDKRDLKSGIKAGVDFIALSFVRSPKDVELLRNILKKSKVSIPIIAKIETQEAIDNLDAILSIADGAMVARGDLAIEAATERVPVYQKDIISRCNYLGKPVITATQMMESMINKPVPTRAEVSDVANAILDGTDALMLSEESALGKYPVEAVAMMSKVAITIEERMITDDEDTTEEIPNVISDAAVLVADSLHAKYIVALSETGSTARLVARFTKNHQIIALTSNLETMRRLTMSAGVIPIRYDNIDSFDEAIAKVPVLLKTLKFVKKGDVIVVTAGVPFKTSGTTNMVFVVKVE